MTTKKQELPVENAEQTEKAMPKPAEKASVDLKELELLKARLAELESMIKDTPKEREPEVVERMRPDEYVSVMNLLPHTLNLSTRGGGQGNVKKFTKFGEVKRILYQDLVDIIEAHHNFVEAGYFYILNPFVIRQHGLDEIYSRILTKEKIEEIVSTKSDECFALYQSANPQQKEIILELLVNRVYENTDSVNLNIVDRISRDSGVDILEKAEDRKRMIKEREEENK